MCLVSPALYSAVNPDEMRYDLKKPCSDCPFRRDVPAHEGIGTAIPSYSENIEKGVFGHTCHKTDPRADGFVPGHKGPVQHCAGGIILLLKAKAQIQVGLLEPMGDGRLDFSKYDRNDPRVFSSIHDMATHYLPFVRKTLDRRAQQEAWRKAGKCDDCGDEFVIPETGKCGFGCDNLSGNRPEA